MFAQRSFFLKRKNYRFNQCILLEKRGRSPKKGRQPLTEPAQEKAMPPEYEEPAKSADKLNEALTDEKAKALADDLFAV